MPSNQSQHESTLNNFLGNVSYRNSSSTKRDVLLVLSNYRGLTPKLEDFTFNDGTRRRLICLDGTIPVPYKGSSYNIPIIIWVLDTHPTNAPICYVRPTTEMSIQVSKHVDQNGKIYLPYLHEWKASESDLLGLIQMCIVVFMEKPPVYSRSPAPIQGPIQGPMQGSMQQPPLQQPPIPPLQPVPGYPPQTYNYSGGTYSPYPPAATGGVPPYPPQNRGGPPYPSPYPPTSSPSGTQGGYPPPYNPPTTNNHSNNNGSSNNSGTITQEHIRVSCLSAVEDKLRRLLREEFEAKQCEFESLTKIKDELNSGKSQLVNAVTQLDKTENQLDLHIAMLKSTANELDGALEKLQQSKEMSVDEAVNTTAPLYKQLLNAFAEEAAIEDSIYYLGEGLRRGVIDCDTFLKHVRKLSRKQFLLRSIMMKCREKAGLTV